MSWGTAPSPPDLRPNGPGAPATACPAPSGRGGLLNQDRQGSPRRSGVGAVGLWLGSVPQPEWGGPPGGPGQVGLGTQPLQRPPPTHTLGTFHSAAGAETLVNQQDERFRNRGQTNCPCVGSGRVLPPDGSLRERPERRVGPSELWGCTCAAPGLSAPSTWSSFSRKGVEARGGGTQVTKQLPLSRRDRGGMPPEAGPCSPPLPGACSYTRTALGACFVG